MVCCWIWDTHKITFVMASTYRIKSGWCATNTTQKIPHCFQLLIRPGLLGSVGYSDHGGPVGISWSYLRLLTLDKMAFHSHNRSVSPFIGGIRTVWRQQSLGPVEVGLGCFLLLKLFFIVTINTSITYPIRFGSFRSESSMPSGSGCWGRQGLN